MPVIATRKGAVEIVETVRASKDDKKNKDKYPENLVQVLCIRYLTTFWNKFVPMSMLFDLANEVNVIYLTFARDLGSSIRLMDVRI